jgi:hypothetical protein
MLDIPPMQTVMEGVKMELMDCSFDLLKGKGHALQDRVCMR